MRSTTATSTTGRRERIGGIVREKLDILLLEATDQVVPQRLIDQARALQAAIDLKETGAGTRETAEDDAPLPAKNSA